MVRDSGTTSITAIIMSRSSITTDSISSEEISSVDLEDIEKLRAELEAHTTNA